MDRLFEEINQNISSIWGQPTSDVSATSSDNIFSKSKRTATNSKNIANVLSYSLTSPNYFVLYIILGFFVINLFNNSSDNIDKISLSELQNFRYTDLLLVIALSLVTFLLTNIKQTPLFYVGYLIGLVILFIIGYKKENGVSEDYNMELCENDSSSLKLEFNFTTVFLLLVIFLIVILTFINVAGSGGGSLMMYLITITTVVIAFIAMIVKKRKRDEYIDQRLDKKMREASKNSDVKITACGIQKSGNYITLNLGTASWLVSLLFANYATSKNNAITTGLSVIQGIVVGMYVAWFSI